MATGCTARSRSLSGPAPASCPGACWYVEFQSRVPQPLSAALFGDELDALRVAGAPIEINELVCPPAPPTRSHSPSGAFRVVLSEWCSLEHH